MKNYLSDVTEGDTVVHFYLSFSLSNTLTLGELLFTDIATPIQLELIFLWTKITYQFPFAIFTSIYRSGRSSKIVFLFC